MTCECCPNQGENYVKYMTMIMCPSCHAKELGLQKESAATAEIRVQEVKDVINPSLIKIQQIDQSIQIKSDIFNAETVAIVDIKKVIDEDTTIDNKNFTLAKIVNDRINLFKKAIFEKNEEIIELNNKQRANQIYLNNLANSLRMEEREAIKLADINYKPNQVKPVKSKPINLAKQKYDKTELNKYAQLIGVPASVIQMVCVAKNMTPEQAANSLKENMK